MSNETAKKAIVAVLKERITTKSFNFNEAAEAIIDGMRLREEWTWRNPNGESGTLLESREDVKVAVEGITPAPVVVHRLVTDWDIE